MWQLYRRILIPAQLFIWTACLTVYFSAGRDLVVAGVMFLVMQVGSIFSAAIGARMKGRAPREADDELPLGRRR